MDHALKLARPETPNLSIECLTSEADVWPSASDGHDIKSIIGDDVLVETTASSKHRKVGSIYSTDARSFEITNNTRLR